MMKQNSFGLLLIPLFLYLFFASAQMLLQIKVRWMTTFEIDKQN